MSYHNTSKARQSRVNAQGQIAPDGYHYMPDGTLMSDIEHARTYGGGTIRSFNLDTTNIKASGEKRRFTITGDGTFSLMIKNESDYYYNFNTNKFQTANTRLANKKIKNTYSGNISFPAAPTTTDVVDGAVTSGVKVVMDNNVATKMEVGDRVTGNAALNAAHVTVVELGTDGNAKKFSMSEAIAIADDAVLIFTGSDQYDIFVFAENGTKHANYNEVRFDDNSIDINSSTGSDSLLLRKVIYQTLDVRLTLSAISPNGETLFSGATATTQVITTQIGKNIGKIPFSIPVSAGSTHSFKIDRTPTISDVAIFVLRNIGSAPVAIEGEDVSGSTYYRWPIDNIDGLSTGMIPKANNITAGTIISSYEEIITELEGTTEEKKVVKVKVKALDKLGKKPTITRNTATKALTTVQTGNIVFNKQQAAALASDEIKIYGYGSPAIKALSGWEIEFSDVIITLTKPTALVTATTFNSTTVAIDDGDGIMDDVSTVGGFNIDSSAASPIVTNIGSYGGSTATLTLSAAQSLEAGETLTFDGAGKTITISGNIEIKKVGDIRSDWNGVLFFDLEKFITATDES
jgi:hypothetical protein